MNRREWLTVAGSGLLAGVAGCLDQVDERADEETGSDEEGDGDEAADTENGEGDGTNEEDSSGGEADDGDGDAEDADDGTRDEDDDGYGDGDDGEEDDDREKETSDDDDQGGEDDDGEDGQSEDDDDEDGQHEDDEQDEEDQDDEEDEHQDDDDDSHEEDEHEDEEDEEDEDEAEEPETAQPVTFSSVSSGGFFWTGEPDESTARDEVIQFPGPGEAEHPIEIDGDVDPDTGNWESTHVAFPRITIDDPVELDIIPVDGLAGELDLDTETLTLEGELLFDFVDHDADFYATVESHTGSSNELDGQFDREGETVAAIVVDNEFVVDDETGDHLIDDNMGLPSLTVGENWFELELALDLEFE